MLAYELYYQVISYIKTITRGKHETDKCNYKTI